jgi:hypothetical protein
MQESPIPINDQLIASIAETGLIHLRYIHTSNISDLCKTILSNRELYPSLPSWTVESDIDFTICQESLNCIDLCASKYSDYLMFHNVKEFDYSKRVVNTFSLEEVLKNYYSSNCESLQGALTLSYHKYLSYKKIDASLNPEQIQAFNDFDNKKSCVKERKRRDRSAYELAQAKWRSAIRKRERVIADVEEEVRLANLAMKKEKAKLGVKR